MIKLILSFVVVMLSTWCARTIDITFRFGLSGLSLYDQSTSNRLMVV